MRKISQISLSNGAREARSRRHAFFVGSVMPSTVIRSFDYDAQRMLLVIEFVSGSVYHYFDVPENLFAEMKSFREKGIFYNQRIKGKFRFERVKER